MLDARTYAADQRMRDASAALAAYRASVARLGPICAAHTARTRPNLRRSRIPAYLYKRSSL
jgi:hypothetical protein